MPNPILDLLREFALKGRVGDGDKPIGTGPRPVRPPRPMAQDATRMDPRAASRMGERARQQRGTASTEENHKAWEENKRLARQRQPMVADAAAIAPRRALPPPQPTIGADTAPEVARVAAQAVEDDIVKRSQAWQEVPAPVRTTVSAGKGVVDAATLGLADNAIAAATEGLSRVTGKEISDPYAEFETLERGTGERIAELGGFAAGAGGLIGMQNSLLARFAARATPGSRAAQLLKGFAPEANLTRAQAIGRNVAEGVPYDLAYDAETPEQRLLNAGLGVAGGVGLGLLGPKGAGRRAMEPAPVLTAAPGGSAGLVKGVGEPNVGDDGRAWYHGTSNEFDAFDDEFRGMGAGGSGTDDGFWFTDEEHAAKLYADYAGKGNGGGRGGGRVVQARLGLRNPLVVDFAEMVDEEVAKFADDVPDLADPAASYLDKYRFVFPEANNIGHEIRNAVQRASAGGHDGVIFRNIIDNPMAADWDTRWADTPQTHALAFNSNAIRPLSGEASDNGGRFFHVADESYTPGEPLESWLRLNERGRAPEWKWEHDPAHRDSDAGGVSLFRTREEAEAARGDLLPAGEIIEVEVPSGVSVKEDSEGFPYIEDTVPAEWIGTGAPGAGMASAFDDVENARQVGLVGASARVDGEEIRSALRSSVGGAAVGAASAEDGDRLEAAARVGLGGAITRGVSSAALKRMGVDPIVMGAIGGKAGAHAESGAVSPGMVRAIASTGAGAAIGGGVDAASGEDSALDGALLGGALGAGVASAPSILRRTREPTGIVGDAAAVLDPPKGLTDEEIAELVGPPTRAELTAAPPPVEGGGVATARVDVDPDDYLNIAKFAQDPAGEEVLRAEMTRVVEREGLAPKEVIGWKQTVAESMGIDADQIVDTPGSELGRTRALAARNIVTTNIDHIKRLSAELADDTLPLDERELVSAKLNALETQNEALLSKFTRARSEAGRTLNSYKILANRTLDSTTWLTKAKSLAGKDYNQDVRAQVLSFINKGDRAGLVQYMTGLRRATWKEKGVTLWKAGLLTSFPTHLTNINGNLAHGAFIAMSETPSAFYDWALSLATGQRTKTGLTPTTLKAAARGARRGLREAKMVMQGVPLEDALRKYDIPKEVNFDSKILDVYTKTVFRSLGAMDRVFRGAGLMASLAEQAQVIARAEGLKGEAYRARVQELIETPSEEMGVRAIEAAERLTFQNDTKAAQIMSKATQVAPVLDIVFPFKRTPSAVGTAVLEYSPFGAAVGTWDAGKILSAAVQGKGRDVLPKEQLRAAELLGRSTTGMAPIAVGFFLYKAGLATGSYSTESDKRNESAIEQKPPNSVLINGRWQNIGRLSPVGNMVSLGANMAAASEDQASLGDRVAQTGFSAIKTVADQPMLTGVQDVTEAITDPGRFAGNYVKRLGGSIIPSGVGAVARATDPVVRQPDGALDAIKARVPGLSDDLAPKITALGDTVRRGDTGISALFNPFAPQDDARDRDPLIAELARVDATSIISPLQREKGSTANEHAARQIVYGAALKRKLQQLVTSDRYRSIPERAETQVWTNEKYMGQDPEALATEKQREQIEKVVDHTRSEFSQYEKRQKAKREREEKRKQEERIRRLGAGDKGRDVVM